MLEFDPEFVVFIASQFGTFTGVGLFTTLWIVLGIEHDSIKSRDWMSDDLKGWILLVMVRMCWEYYDGRQYVITTGCSSLL